MIKFLTMFQDVFAWSYDDISEISTDIVVIDCQLIQNFHQSSRGLANLNWI